MNRKFINKKCWKKIIGVFLCAVCLGLLISVGAAGISYLQAGANRGEIEITSDMIECPEGTENNNIYYISKEGGTLELCFKNGVYINKLQYQYKVKESVEGKSSITFYTKNVYGEDATEVVSDTYFVNAPRSVVNVNANVEKIVIEFPETVEGIEVQEFKIDNTFKWNPLLAIMICTFAFVILYLIIFFKENARYPGVAAVVCIFSFSVCMLIMQPPFCSGWDEQIHFYTAYDLALLPAEETNSEIVYYLAGNAPWLNEHNEISIEERIDLIRIMNSQAEINNEGIREVDLQLSSAGYVFQALAITIGKLLRLPFYLVWLLGKFTNVLLYAILMGCSISIVPIGKRLLSVISILPIMIFSSTIYTYDITVTGFITLGICILVKEVLNKEKVFDYKWRAVYIGCIVAGCLPKAVYAPLILCAAFLPDSKFYSKKDKYIFRGTVVGAFLILMSSFVLPTLINPPEVADTRGGDTSVSRQLKYIFGQPISYAIVLLSNIKETLVEYLTGDMLNRMGYMGRGTMAMVYSMLVIGTALTDTYNDTKTRYGKKEKTVSLVMIFATIALIWTALYLAFTEVGNVLIAGVQGRYYLPFIFLFYLLFRTDAIKNEIEVEKYQMLVMVIAAILLITQIYSVFFLNSCM